MSQTLPIKPLSVNKAWQGKRFKTPEYKRYELDVSALLKRGVVPDSELDISFRFGFSNIQSDVDNPVKCLLDILQKRYGFNDSKVMRLNLEKEKVKKGEEYIHFTINEYKKA